MHGLRRSGELVEIDGLDDCGTDDGDDSWKHGGGKVTARLLALS